jgi:hypothetical protein
MNYIVRKVSRNSRCEVPFWLTPDDPFIIPLMVAILYPARYRIGLLPIQTVVYLPLIPGMFQTHSRTGKFGDVRPLKRHIMGVVIGIMVRTGSLRKPCSNLVTFHDIIGNGLQINLRKTMRSAKARFHRYPIPARFILHSAMLG